MKYTHIIRRETKVMILVVFVLLMAVLGMSYAFYMRVDENTNDQVVTTANLQITYESTNGYISQGEYNEIVPMSNDRGLALDGYQFEVENTGNLKTAYQVYLYVDEAGYQAAYNAGTINKPLFTAMDKMKYNIRVNSDTNTDINYITKTCYITDNGIRKYKLFNKELNKNATDTNILRLWLDEDTDIQEIEKYIYLKLEVVSYIAGQEEAQNITCPYKCIRARTLHTDGTHTYGNRGTQGQTMAAGDAFDCDVNGDHDYDAATERFYYVADVDANTAALIYYNNVSAGVASNSTTYAYDAGGDVYSNGPVAALAQLPTTTQWSNVLLTSTTRDIKDENGTVKKVNFDYGNAAARLITVQEINTACGITVGTYTTGELDSCIYLLENTKYQDLSLSNYGYWSESANSSDLTGAWHIYGNGRRVSVYGVINDDGYGVRPVIEVAKTDIDY